MPERNRLQAGTYVEPLPLGLPVTLKYKDNGVLETVYIGYFDNTWEQSKEIYEYLLESNAAPIHLDVKDGTMFVRGVLYSGNEYDACGDVPEGIESQVIFDIENGVFHNFFAGQITSSSIDFSSINATRTWLQTHKFNILPGYLVPHDDSTRSIKQLMEASEFEYETIFGYFIFDNNDFFIEYTNIAIDEIENSDVYLDKAGYIHCDVKLTFKGRRQISFYDRQRLGLDTKCKVILDDIGEISCRYPVDETISSSFNYSCPMCGCVYVVEDEFTRCPDIHCVSRLFSDINHFLAVLELPQWEYAAYLAALDNGFKKFSDVMLFEPYKDEEVVVSLSTLIDAVIPIWAVRNRESIWKLYSLCNGSQESIEFYINNPMRIPIDLHIDDQSLVNWLNDEKNLENLLDIISYSNFVLTGAEKKFEGAPIFRDKKIYLTGKFVHGSYIEIASILRSYGAAISGPEDADCCIIGDIPEDIDGHKVNMIKNRGAAIFNEMEFFKKYEIDDDLQ